MLESRAMTPAPGDAIAEPRDYAKQTWKTAIETWLAQLRPKTRESYRVAIRDFFALIPRTPDRVTVADVVSFQAHLRARGNSDGTVACRLAALSSLYRFLCRSLDARGTSLCQGNPFASVQRPKVEPFARPRKMRLSDFAAILGALNNRSDLAALRDRALLLCYVLTGRRRSEVVALRGRDLERMDGGGIAYRYLGKRGKTGLRELPGPAADALRAYLDASGRSELGDADAVFLSLSGPKKNRPLTSGGVLSILKARARAAGIPPERVRVHGLRHLAAELRRASGVSIEEVSSFLDHASLTTTQTYLARIEGKTDSSWAGAWAILSRALVPAS